jgi:NADPH:quinone reductase-like Zn-dependent oxidoreductase
MVSLGAETAVDYHAADWQRDVRDWSGGGVEAALAILPKTEADAISVVRDGGRIITVSGYDGNSLPVRGITIAQMTFLHVGRQDVERLLSAIVEGSIRAVIEAEYLFDRALEA